MKLMEIALLGGLAYVLLTKKARANDAPNNTSQSDVSIPAGTQAGGVVVSQPISSVREGIDFINTKVLNKATKVYASAPATSGGVNSYAQKVGNTTVRFTTNVGQPKVYTNKYGRTTILQNGAKKLGYS